MSRVRILLFATVGNVTIAAFLIAAAWMVGRGGAYDFRTSPTEFCREVYGINPLPEAIEVAAHVKG